MDGKLPHEHGIEEILDLKRKCLPTILAVIPAVIFSIAAAGQVSPAGGTGTAEKLEPNYRWAASAGYGYTSLNQVNQSRSGLQGVDLSIMRNWGKHFGLIADGAYYKYAIVNGNPGSPGVDLVLFGPVLHAELYGHISGFVRGLLGGAHTAGESETPNVSFAGGFGAGMEYSLSPRLSLRAAGDDIYSSFVEDPQHLGYSPHLRGNARASFGVVYKF